MAEGWGSTRTPHPPPTLLSRFSFFSSSRCSWDVLYLLPVLKPSVLLELWFVLIILCYNIRLAENERKSELCSFWRPQWWAYAQGSEAAEQHCVKPRGNDCSSIICDGTVRNKKISAYWWDLRRRSAFHVIRSLSLFTAMRLPTFSWLRYMSA